MIYPTCFENFHNTAIGQATLDVLAKNGVETEVVHPACCGMPKLELGDLETVAQVARTISDALLHKHHYRKHGPKAYYGQSGS